MKSNHAEFIKSEPLSTSNSHIHAARLEITKGAITEPQSHSWETIIIVLEGACRLRVAERVVTLKNDEVVRIPARESYSAEALADTIALKIATVSRQVVLGRTQSGS